MRLTPLSIFVAGTLLGATACMKNEPVLGDLIVITNSTGTPDPNGYVLHVAGQDSVAMADDDTTRFNGLELGDYVVKLGNVYPGCVVAGGDSQLVYVPFGVKKLELDVHCP